MRANVDSKYSASLSVYLNGKRLTDCLEGDEEAGYVWVQYRNAKGERMTEINAEAGALVHEGLQVIKLHGKVEFTVDPEDAAYFGLTLEQFKREIEESFVPIQPTAK